MSGFGRYFLNSGQRTWSAKSLSIKYLKLFCLVQFVDEYCLDVRPSAGPSMVPTLATSNDSLVNVRLPFYRMIRSWLPDQCKAPSFLTQQGEKGDASLGMGIAVGDLVSAISPRDPSVEVCKRVLGLAGDTILLDPRLDIPESHDDQWGELAKTSGRNIDCSREAVYIVIPKGHVWLGGDNFANSYDSRKYGPVPLGLVRGRIVARITPWPMSWLPNTLRMVPQS